MWGAAPKKSTKNAICATFRRRIVNDSRSLYRARRASYISIFSPPTIRRKTIFQSRRNEPSYSGLQVTLARRRVAYIFGVGRGTHTFAPEQKITIAFLTEKDGQMAEKRRKKRRPFCLAHLRLGEVRFMYAIFFWEKKPTKTNARGRVLWPTLEKFSLPLRDAVAGAIFFREQFSYEKNGVVALRSQRALSSIECRYRAVGHTNEFILNAITENNLD